MRRGGSGAPKRVRGPSCVEVRPSKVHGLGCFALRPIPADRRIMRYTGELIGLDEAVRRNRKGEPQYSDYVLEITPELFVDGIRSGHASRYVNHSCAPNCILEARGEKIYIVSLREIAPGEELTYDYAFDEDQREPCSCGSPHCRGYI